MGASQRWMESRLQLSELRRALLDREVPDRLTWWHTLGSATLAVFVVQVVTGAVLATFYSPAPDHAYDSVRYIETGVRMGGFLRGMHRWAASFMVVLVVAHMIRVFSMGAYKYPREANWLLGVGLFVLVMGFGFTGYRLPWDQKAYWATQVGTSMAGTTPWIGAALASLLRGGGAARRRNADTILCPARPLAPRAVDGARAVAPRLGGSAGDRAAHRCAGGGRAASHVGGGLRCVLSGALSAIEARGHSLLA